MNELEQLENINVDKLYKEAIAIQTYIECYK